MADNKVRRCLRNNLLVILTVLGAIIGVTIGLMVRQITVSEDVLRWIGLPGDVYMRSLKMVVLPLIVASVITGTASTDPKVNGRISVVSLVYIIVSNGLSCIAPAVVMLATGLGKGAGKTLIKVNVNKGDTTVMETSDVFMDLIRNIFPDNIIAASFEQAQTQYKTEIIRSPVNESTDFNITLLIGNETQDVVTSKYVGINPATNVLGLVVCSYIIGMATSSVGPAGRPFFAFFQSANTVIIKVMSWLVWGTPIGVVSLIAVAFIEAAHLESILQSLGLFSVTLTGCLLLHVAMMALVIHWCIVRSNPFPFLASLARPVIVAFGTTSSAVALPETIHALETKNGIDSRVTRFVIPLAVTINRGGTCVFMTLSCFFISHLTGHDLNAGQVVIMWILLTVLSLATPSVPSGSIVAIIIILSSMGIPTQLVGILFATEWILDRLRTSVNCISHCFGAVVTYHFCRNHLPPIDDSFNERGSLIVVDKNGSGCPQLSSLENPNPNCCAKSSRLTNKSRGAGQDFVLLSNSKC